MIEIFDYQKEAIDKLRPGSILVGGTGSGKSRTALYFFYTKICNGMIETMFINEKTGEKKAINEHWKSNKLKDLYIITTAKKRDDKEWEQEVIPFEVEEKGNMNVVIDSWNNISKYTKVQDAFFIFDEQRVVGSGMWAKTFVKISKNNLWIMLTATPGDSWIEFAAVFVANGFYKNRTEFIIRHVVYNRFAKYRIDKYLEIPRLIQLRDKIQVKMNYIQDATKHYETIKVEYDEEKYKYVNKHHWNIYKDEPLVNASEYCYCVRRITNSSPDRIAKTKELIRENPRIIIFYNFDYELEFLRSICESLDMPYSEWNGHVHQPIKDTEKWVYIVNYSAGSEGWNCIKTNVILFFSQTYSYKIRKQAEGRIDRLNTPFKELYYYTLKSSSVIDSKIYLAYKMKKNFNEGDFVKKLNLGNHLKIDEAQNLQLI